MTGAVFYRRDGRLTGFKVSGHTDDSGSAEARIVCSAVSSAVYLTANTLTDVVGAEAEIKVSDGDFSLFVKGDDPREQDLLKGLRLHLSQLAEQYHNYIVIKTEVQHDA